MMSRRTELSVFAFANGHSLSRTKKDPDISSHIFSFYLHMIWSVATKQEVFITGNSVRL